MQQHVSQRDPSKFLSFIGNIHVIRCHTELQAGHILLSRTFANSMCKKISSMVKRISTPNELKLRLIPILKHMHHDVVIASTVSSCNELFGADTTFAFSCVVIYIVIVTTILFTW